MSRHPIVIGISAVMVLLGVVALFRHVKPGLYAELRDHHLLLNILFPIRIGYGNIVRTENPIAKQGDFMRSISNAVVAWNRLLGGDFPWIPPKGEVETSTVVVSFRRRIWPPPFFIPRKSWRLMVEDAEALRDELLKRASA